MVSFIFECLHERAANGGFGRTDGGDQGGGKNCGNHEEHERHGEDVIHLDSAQVPPAHSQGVVQIDRTQTHAQDETDHANAQGLDPHRSSDLIPKASTACITLSSRRRSVMETVSVLTMPRMATRIATTIWLYVIANHWSRIFMIHSRTSRFVRTNNRRLPSRASTTRRRTSPGSRPFLT